MRVLVAEDEEDLALAIAQGLRREGMAVDIAPDGQEALQKLEVSTYDVLLLDRDLPRVHGDRVCREVTASGQPTRILMLTASVDIEDRVHGLNLGADDYLGKPFAFSELVARVRALGRRASGAAHPVLQAGDLRIIPALHEASRGGRPIPLSLKEFAVLETLLKARGAIVSPEELLEKVWDESVDPFSNTVRVTVMRLRQKLGSPELIETAVGLGYRVRI